MANVFARIVPKIWLRGFDIASKCCNLGIVLYPHSCYPLPFLYFLARFSFHCLLLRAVPVACHVAARTAAGRRTSRVDVCDASVRRARARRAPLFGLAVASGAVGLQVDGAQTAAAAAWLAASLNGGAIAAQWRLPRVWLSATAVGTGGTVDARELEAMETCDTLSQYDCCRK